MTNKRMWELVKLRIFYYHKRIFEPFGLSKKGDVAEAAKLMKTGFDRSRNHSRWVSKFFDAIEKEETYISLRERTPKSFKDEMEYIFYAYFLR